MKGNNTAPSMGKEKSDDHEEHTESESRKCTDAECTKNKKSLGALVIMATGTMSEPVEIKVGTDNNRYKNGSSKM
eukprot:11468121-Ditylum_brightwellii.AAC.1